MTVGCYEGLTIERKNKNPFKGRQFTAEIILWAVRWYLQFPISYRDLEDSDGTPHLLTSRF